ncbi:hypothetical protein AV654_17595 [Paenibacillus elgii]|uniref:Uncharacterized protein n=1 Tax=Paenibacillus elgii TaxID=189691 RepID=A0A161SEJ8_9BACL|nr:hypothetical protein [Paenibacillus elgii]KZE79285.1 hypothetical protein AV654_17595 [Paenibacillus elgii]
MTVQINITGESAHDAVKELAALASHISPNFTSAAPHFAASGAVPVPVATPTPQSASMAPQPSAVPVFAPQYPSNDQLQFVSQAHPAQQPAMAPPTQPGYGQQPPVQTGAVPTTGMAPDQLPSQQPPAQTAVPTATQSYTLEQLAVAATPLMDSGKRAELAQLLQQFGAQSLTQLAKERYGEFATALRGLGARI